MAKACKDAHLCLLMYFVLLIRRRGHCLAAQSAALHEAGAGWCKFGTLR